MRGDCGRLRTCPSHNSLRLGLPGAPGPRRGADRMPGHSLPNGAEPTGRHAQGDCGRLPVRRSGAWSRSSVQRPADPAGPAATGESRGALPVTNGPEAPERGPFAAAWPGGGGSAAPARAQAANLAAQAAASARHPGRPRVTPPYYWLVPAIHVGARPEPANEPEQRPLRRRSRQKWAWGERGGDRRGLERQQGRQGLPQLGGATRTGTPSGSAAWTRPWREWPAA